MSEGQTAVEETTAEIDKLNKATFLYERIKQLTGENTISELRDLHMKTFSIAHKGKDKVKIATKIARHELGETKDETSTESPEMVAGPKPEELERMAGETLARCLQAWDEIDVLKEKRSSEMAEFSDVISTARERIGDTFKDANSSDANKISKLDGHWRTIMRTEDKRQARRDHYKDKLKAAGQRVRDEFNNSRQLALFNSN